jgi:hypothetical protein
MATTTVIDSPLKDLKVTPRYAEMLVTRPGRKRFVGKTGEVLAHHFNADGLVVLLIRFGADLETFLHDEVEIDPDFYQLVFSEDDARH